MSKVAKKEKKMQTVSTSSQQKKPNYCMCFLPLPSLWLAGSAFMDEKEYLIYLKKQNKTKTNKKKTIGNISQ